MTGLSVGLANVGRDGFNALLPAIYANTGSLEILGFMGGIATDANWQTFVSFFANNRFSQLREVYLNKQDLSTRIVLFASDVLQHLLALEQIALECDNIGDDGAAAIASTLHHLPLLQKLFLSLNQIGDAGPLPFLQLGLTLLPPPSSLRYIDLSANLGQPPLHQLSEEEKSRCPFIVF